MYFPCFFLFDVTLHVFSSWILSGRLQWKYALALSSKWSWLSRQKKSASVIFVPRFVTAPLLTLQKPPLNFLPAQPWAPFDFLVLLISQKDPGPAKRVSISWLFRFCQSHTLPGNFRIKSQWHFYQLLCLKTTIFKHRFQKRQYFDLLSRQRQASVPLVLFSASLWDQLSKILNRDLFFHNLLVFLHHSQLLTNLRAKSWEK